MNVRQKEITYLLLTLFTFVGGYFFLRYAYKVSDTVPFSQKIVLIILGTIATVFITSLLLNKQTAMELEKEQSIKFLHLKTAIYENLLDLIEEMSTKERIAQSDLSRLHFLTHKLAIVASPSVLDEYNRFLKVISESAHDTTFRNDTAAISDALCRLTVRIRADLLGEQAKEGDYSESEITDIIIKNANDANRLEQIK